MKVLTTLIATNSLPVPRWLKALAAAPASAPVLAALLRDCMASLPVNAEYLRSSNAGKVISGFMKDHSNADVRQAAEYVVTEWKARVNGRKAGEAARPAPVSAPPPDASARLHPISPRDSAAAAAPLSLPFQTQHPAASLKRPREESAPSGLPSLNLKFNGTNRIGRLGGGGGGGGPLPSLGGPLLGMTPRASPSPEAEAHSPSDLTRDMHFVPGAQQAQSRPAKKKKTVRVRFVDEEPSSKSQPLVKASRSREALVEISENVLDLLSPSLFQTP